MINNIQKGDRAAYTDLPARIKTPRFTLRPIGVEDGRFFWEHFSDATIMAYIREPASDKKAFLDEFEADLQKGQKYRHYRLIEDPETGGAVGIILLRPPSEDTPFANDKPMELGYMVTQSWWGKGVAFEVAECYKNTALQHWEIGHLLAVVQPENTASVKILEKCGFKASDQTSRDGKAVIYLYAR